MVRRESRLANVMTRPRLRFGHSEMKSSNTTRKNRNAVIVGTTRETVGGTQEIPGKGSPAAALFGGSPIIAARRRRAATSPSNTWSFSFSDPMMPGRALVNSDTCGKIKRMTRATTSVKPATSNKAESARGTRSASSLLAAGPNMAPTTKAATTGSMISRAA